MEGRTSEVIAAELEAERKRAAHFAGQVSRYMHEGNREEADRRRALMEQSRNRVIALKAELKAFFS